MLDESLGLRINLKDSGGRFRDLLLLLLLSKFTCLLKAPPANLGRPAPALSPLAHSGGATTVGFHRGTRKVGNQQVLGVSLKISLFDPLLAERKRIVLLSV